jgi:hypothetical protein
MQIEPRRCECDRAKKVYAYPTVEQAGMTEEEGFSKKFERTTIGRKKR